MPTASSSRRDLLLALGLGVAALVLYLSTLSHGHLGDPMAYAEEVAGGRWFHPRHLLHNLVGSWLGYWIQALRPEWGWMDGLQRMQAGIGALGVALFAWVLRRGGVSSAVTAAAAVLLATSHGWWSLAVTYEVHLLPVLWMLGVVAVLLRPPADPRVEGALLGVAHAGAILFHQTMVLAGPALLLATLLRPGRAARAGLYLATGVGLVLVGYGLSFLWPAHQLIAPDQSAFGFVLGDATEGHPGVGDTTVWRSLSVGAREVFLAARRGLCVPPSDLGGMAGGPADVGAAGPAGLLGLVGAAVLLLAGLPRLWRRHRDVVVLVLGWIAVVAPVVAWWEPGNFEYFLGPGVALLVLLALAGAALAEGRTKLSPLIALAWLGVAAPLAVANHQVAIGPRHDRPWPHHRCGEGAVGGPESGGPSPRPKLPEPVNSVDGMRPGGGPPKPRPR
ncbi:MAG: hypothetical protein H6742_18050 [Alphaproteobacteria bacterium]|nr:hypothetical protein [Alphaproteobacteria bacterium]